MRIADVLRNKGAAVVTINPDATVPGTAGRPRRPEHRRHGGGRRRRCRRHRLGARRRAPAAHARRQRAVPPGLAQIMTATVATCTKSDTVDSLSVLMTKNRVRHVPVLDGQKADRHRQHRRRREDADGRTRGRARSSCSPTSRRADRLSAAQRQEYSARSRAATTSKSVAIQDRALAADALLGHVEHPVQPDPAFPALVIPIASNRSRPSPGQRRGVPGWTSSARAGRCGRGPRPAPVGLCRGWDRPRRPPTSTRSRRDRPGHRGWGRRPACGPAARWERWCWSPAGRR